MKTSRPALLLLALLVALGGCASTGTSSTGGSRDEITREQMAEMPQATAYDVVRRFHNEWLRPRGVGTSANPDANAVAVYVDGQRDPAGLDALRSYRASELMSIEYFDSRRATTRWGTGHSAGAILLSRL